MTPAQAEIVHRALDGFHIELPSWGFADTGTRFGKSLQPAAAVTIDEKFSDAGRVHALTGVCPTLALHVLWDLPDGAVSAAEVQLKGKIEAMIQTVMMAQALYAKAAIAEWRRARGLRGDPLDAFRESGYQARITAARAGRGAAGPSSYA
jgi:L-rhamnose isomerase